MADIPIVTNDKGDVLGWDGQQWRPPDSVAQHPSGRKAYLFGQQWQVGPETNEWLNTARIAGTAAVQGATDVANIPSTVVGLTGEMGEGLAANMPGKPAVAPISPFGSPSFAGAFLKPRPVENRPGAARETAQKFSKSLDVRPFVENTIGLPTDANKEAERLGADMTPLRKSIASGVRTATGSALMGAGAPAALLSGAGAAAGRYVGGDVGEVAGAFAGPLVGLGAARALRPKSPAPPAVPGERASSEALSDALKQTYRSEKAIVAPEIDAAKATIAQRKMPTNAVKGYAQKYLDGLTAAKRSMIPLKPLEDALATGGKAVNFAEIDDALSVMKRLARGMPEGTADLVQTEKFIGHMMKLAPYKAPGVKGGFSQYAQFKQEFGDKSFGRVFQEGKKAIPPSEMGEAVSRLPVEAQEALKRYPAIRKAMETYNKSRKVAIIEKAIEDAGLSAKKFSQSGYENAVRDQFRSLAKNADKMALFSDAERKMIKRMAEGTIGLNALRLFGKAAPTGGLSQMLYGGALGSGFANPAMFAAVPAAAAVTSAARVGANKLGKAMAQEIADTIRRGGPALTRSMTSAEKAAVRALIYGPGTQAIQH